MTAGALNLGLRAEPETSLTAPLTWMLDFSGEKEYGKLSVCLSVCLSLCLSLCLSVCLSVSASAHNDECLVAPPSIPQLLKEERNRKPHERKDVETEDPKSLSEVAHLNTSSSSRL